MSQVILVLLTVGVTVYALVDCWTSADDQVRSLPRAAWILVILLIPLVGAVCYVMFGRASVTGGYGVPGARVIAPDDDPDFLRQLEQRRRESAAEEKRMREQRERRERREAERQERKDRKSGTEGSDGEDHSDRTTG